MPFFRICSRCLIIKLLGVYTGPQHFEPRVQLLFFPSKDLQRKSLFQTPSLWFMHLYEQFCIKWDWCSTEHCTSTWRAFLFLVWTGSANYSEWIWPSSRDYQAAAGRNQQHTCEYPKGVEGESQSQGTF